MLDAERGTVSPRLHMVIMRADIPCCKWLLTNMHGML